MSSLQIEQVLAQIRAFAPKSPGAFVAGANNAATLTAAAGQLSASGATSFSQLLKQGVDAVNHSQQRAATLADGFQRGAAGVDLASVMLESQKASVSFRALTEVRNRLVNVYQEIMNMPI